MGNGFKATEKKKGKNIVTITDTDSRKIMEQTKKGEIIKVLDVKQRVNPFNKKMEQNISNKMEMKGEIPEEHTNEDWEVAKQSQKKVWNKKYNNKNLDMDEDTIFMVMNQLMMYCMIFVEK